MPALPLITPLNVVCECSLIAMQQGLFSSLEGPIQEQVVALSKAQKRPNFSTSFLQKETFFHNGRKTILQRKLIKAFTIYAKDNQFMILSCITGSNFQLPIPKLRILNFHDFFDQSD